MNKKSINKKAQLKMKKHNLKHPETDIIQLILKDHRPLKAFIETMKGEKPSYTQKRAAFHKFAPALIAHAKPEEQTWYTEMKSKKATRVEGLEGDVEHGLADQLCEDLKHTENQDQFMAKVKVLAELVEHHIEEEENEMLPTFKKVSTIEERTALGENYIKTQQEFLSQQGQNESREKRSNFNQSDVSSPSPS